MLEPNARESFPPPGPPVPFFPFSSDAPGVFRGAFGALALREGDRAKQDAI